MPHWEEHGATYFVCLTLGRPVRVDLASASIAPMVVDALRFYDQKHYDLYDYTVMPDHLHIIIKPLANDDGTERLGYIMRNLKRWMTRRIKELVPGAEVRWQDEDYDHIIRNREDYEEKAKYIFENAWAAGLVSDPLAWPWWGRGSGE